MATHYYTVTWDQLHRDARALAWRLIEKGPYTGIVAISRGGLIPAAIVARELECRLIESVSVVTYDEEAMGTPVVNKPATAPGFWWSTIWWTAAAPRAWCAAFCRRPISPASTPSRRGARWSIRL
jgi:hypothetical protein